MKECVLLTRPEGENELLASKLASSGWDVLVRPMLKIEGLRPRTQHLSNLTIFDFSYISFTFKFSNSDKSRRNLDNSFLSNFSSQYNFAINIFNMYFLSYLLKKFKI